MQKKKQKHFFVRSRSLFFMVHFGRRPANVSFLWALFFCSAVSAAALAYYFEQQPFFGSLVFSNNFTEPFSFLLLSRDASVPRIEMNARALINDPTGYELRMGQYILRGKIEKKRNKVQRRKEAFVKWDYPPFLSLSLSPLSLSLSLSLINSSSLTHAHT